MENIEHLVGELNGIGQLTGYLSLPQGAAEIYGGSYEVTPTQETQILPTAGTQLLENVVINPIPSNYGLITWNGAYITVS